MAEGGYKRFVWRLRREKPFYLLLLGATIFGIIALLILLIDIFADGLGWLNWGFITNYPSRFPEQAGLKSALFGTIWVIGLTALFSFPIGVASAIYLEEYTKKNWLSRLIQLNIFNLAGVPSIVYGLFGLLFFVQWLGLGRSILAAALTLSLLTLPVIIVSTQEALRTVPQEYRLAAYALGATTWQVVRGVVLPTAFPGILTGTILALSRAIGEAAPLLAVAALAYITFIPTNPMDQFTVLPIQIFNWISRPQPEFHKLAAAGIIVLMGILFIMNAGAIFLRQRFQQRLRE